MTHSLKPLCKWCDEELECPHPVLTDLHVECAIRMVMGSVGHLLGKCHCHGGDQHDNPALTKREQAKEALKVHLWQLHDSSHTLTRPS